MAFDPTSAGDARFVENEAQPRDFWALLKPRVMSLVIFTALVGMLAAPSEMHPTVALASILCIAVGAGASGALNMWWDADIDAEMARTAKRPVAAGVITPGEALSVGLGLSVLSVAMLALFANVAAAALLGFTIWFYAVFYTMWLKRSTPQNIVIGGAAGAFPPMVGWVAATGSVTLEPVLMFLLIFLWTPPHFWALALWRNEEFKRVNIPMMPVVAGQKATRDQILWYSVALAMASLALCFTDATSWLYLAAALVCNAVFVGRAWQVWRRDEDAAKAENYLAEKRLFGFSLLYLALLFTAILGDAVLIRAGVF